MPNINLDDAYILDETGAQVDKVTGLFTKDEDTTSGEKAFAQLNIGTAGSNRNLLDNPWFTVNQRGVNGTITNGQYGLDRWIVGGGTVTMATGGITLGAGNSYALQRPADPSIFNGKTVTLSVMTSDGVVESGTVVAQTGSAKTVRTANFELCIGYTEYNSFYFYNTSSSAKTVIAAKLELGSVSTLANDAPPDYAEELLKCLRYQWIVDAESVYGVVGDATVTTQNTEAMMVVHYPVPMYKVPTLSVSGAFRTVGGNGSSIQIGSVTSMTVTSNSSNKNFARVTINGTNMGNTGTSVVVGANNSASAKLIFDANI